MPRLSIFAKGNIDVRDSLHAYRSGGVLRWNGINAVLRDRHPGWTVRLRHETFTRSDALLAASGAVPDAIAAQAIDFGPYPLASQFGTAAFMPGSDAAILSIQPDVAHRLARHRDGGALLYPNRFGDWTPAQQRWLRAGFDMAGLLDPADSMANLAVVAGRLRAAGVRHILVYNLSAVVTGEWVHCHLGAAEALSTRIRWFNLALAGLSAETGISVVDVDAVVARAGADRVKLDAWRLDSEGCRLVAEEVVRVLEDLGCFGDAA